MKKTIIILLFIFAAQNVFALDFSVGLSGWFGDFYSKEADQITSGKSELFSGEISDVSSDKERKYDLYYGPIFGIRYERWSFGMHFIFTDTTLFKIYNKGDGDEHSFTMNTGALTYVNQVWNGKRRDADLSLSYSLNNNFSLFGGYKLFYYDFNIAISQVGALPVEYTIHTTTLFNGPAAGVSASYPITDNFFLNAALSGLYSFADKKTKAVNSINGTVYADNEKKYRYYGFNSTAGFGYFMSSISTTMLLGGRYQYLTDGEDKLEKIWGVTFSVIYSI